MNRYALIGRADNLARVDKLLNAVGAPARDAGNGENRRKQLGGQIEHAVDKAAVEVDVGADALVNFPVVGDDLGARRSTRE